jgi:hypothetical protein
LAYNEAFLSYNEAALLYARKSLSPDETSPAGRDDIISRQPPGQHGREMGQSNQMGLLLILKIITA